MRFATFCIAFLSMALCLGQAPTPPSDIDDEELRDWLRQNWYLPWHEALGYTPARVAMFWEIDNQGGQVSCVYSGFSQAAAETSFLDPINTEHTIPQSWFNQLEPMRSDLHHLFPTHGQVNGARGSLGFSEVPDSQADVWYTGSPNDLDNSGNTPSGNNAAWCEVQYNVAFEPREDFKGNTARAVFYFFTMYPQYINGYLSEIGSLEWLYQWHVTDPPDAQEVERNEEIQDIQGNYNPYIHSPELLGIAWNFVSDIDENHIELEVFPNPAVDELIVRTALPLTSMRILDMQGRTVSSTPVDNDRIDITSLPVGVYIIEVMDVDGGIGRRRIIKQDGR